MPFAAVLVADERIATQQQHNRSGSAGIKNTKLNPFTGRQK